MAPAQSPHTAGTWRRRAALVAVAAAVLLVHVLVTDRVMGQMQELAAEGPLIKRMEAVMVADMTLSAPPVVAPLPLPQAMAPAQPAAPQAASAASEPASSTEATEAPPLAPEAASEAASEPAAPAPAPEAAASAPDDTAATALADASPAPAEAASPADMAGAPADTAQAAADATPFEWPLATRVTFKAEGYIRGPIYGQAQVEWVRQDMRYQVRIDASVGPSFAPLGSQRWTSEGEITPEGLEPRRFESINKLLISSSKPRRVTFHPHEVELADGQHVPKMPMVQDPASHYIQLAYMALRRPELLQVGGTLSMPLAWTRKQDTVIYDVQAREALDTPLGKIETLRLKPRPLASQKDKDKARDEVLAEIWIAPSLQYLPIRMLLRQGAANYLDMKMDRMPQQAAATAPGASQAGR